MSSSTKVKGEKTKRKSKISSPNDNSSSTNDDASTATTTEESTKSDKTEEKSKSKKSKKKSKKKKSGADEESCSIASGSSYYHYDSDSSLSSSGSELLTEEVKNKKFRKVMAKEASKSSLLDSASIRNGSFRRRSLLSDEDDDSTNREEDELSEFQMDLTFLKSSFHNHQHMNPTTNNSGSVGASSLGGVPDVNNNALNIGSGSGGGNYNSSTFSTYSAHNSVPNLNVNVKKTKLGRVKSTSSDERERSNVFRDSGRTTSSKEKKDKRKKEDSNSNNSNNINQNSNSIEAAKEEIFNWASVAEEGDKKRGSKKSTSSSSTNKKDKSPDPSSRRGDVPYSKPRLRRSKSSGDSTDWSMFRSFAKRTKQLASKKSTPPDNNNNNNNSEELTTNSKRKSKKGKDGGVAAEADEDEPNKKKGKKPKEEPTTNEADSREMKKKKGKRDKTTTGTDGDDTMEERRMSGEEFDVVDKHDWQALVQSDQARKHDWQALAQIEDQRKKAKEKKDKKRVADKEGNKGRKNSFEDDDQGSRIPSGEIDGDYVYNWSPKKLPTKSPKKSRLKKTNSSEGNALALPSPPLTKQSSTRRFGERTQKLRVKKTMSTGSTPSPSLQPLTPAATLPSSDSTTDKSDELKRSASSESNCSYDVQTPKQSTELPGEKGKEDVTPIKDTGSDDKDNNDNAPADQQPSPGAIQKGDTTASEDASKSNLSSDDDDNMLPAIQPLKRESLSISEVASVQSRSDDALGGGKTEEERTPQPKKATGSSASSMPADTVSSLETMSQSDDSLGSRMVDKPSAKKAADLSSTMDSSSRCDVSLEDSNKSMGQQSSEFRKATGTALSLKDAAKTMETSSRTDNSLGGTNSKAIDTPKSKKFAGSTASVTSETASLGGSHNDDAAESRNPSESSSGSVPDTASTVETSSWSDGSQLQGKEKNKTGSPAQLDQPKEGYGVVKVSGPGKSPKKKKKRSIAKLNLEMQQSAMDKGEGEYQDALVTYANSIMKLFTDDPTQYSDEAAVALLREFPQAAKMKFDLESSSFRGGQGKTRHYLLSLLCALGASRDATAMCFNLHPDAIHKFDEHVGTPLHYAISFGITASFSREMWTDSIFDTVEFLLKQEPLLLSSQHNDQSQSALHQAILSLCPSGESMPAGQKHLKDYGQLTAIADVVISMLLENHNLIATLPDAKNLLPLHLAALRAVPVEILGRILKEYTPGCTVKCYAKGFTPLHYAVQVFGFAGSTIMNKDESEAPSSTNPLEDHAANIETLIDGNAAAAQIQDNSGDLPLHVLVSAFYGQYSMEKQSVRVRDGDDSGSIFVKVVRALSLAYPEAANTPGSSGKTPLMIVEKHGGSTAVVDAMTNSTTAKESVVKASSLP